MKFFAVFVGLMVFAALATAGQSLVIVLILNAIGIPSLAALTFWQVFGFVVIFDVLMAGSVVSNSIASS